MRSMNDVKVMEFMKDIKRALYVEIDIHVPGYYKKHDIADVLNGELQKVRHDPTKDDFVRLAAIALQGYVGGVK